MTAAQVYESEGQQVPWWLILMEGIALVFLGVLLLIKPGMTALFFIQFLGVYWLVGGIFKLVSLFIDRSLWGWKLLAGILGIIAGIIVIQYPIWSPVVIGSWIVILLGIQGIIYGGVGIFQAFKGAGWGAAILGAISIVFGIYLLANIGAATLALPWVVAVFALVGGVAAIVMAFRVKA